MLLSNACPVLSVHNPRLGRYASTVSSLEADNKAALMLWSVEDLVPLIISISSQMVSLATCSRLAASPLKDADKIKRRDFLHLLHSEDLGLPDQTRLLFFISANDVEHQANITRRSPAHPPLEAAPDDVEAPFATLS